MAQLPGAHMRLENLCVQLERIAMSPAEEPGVCSITTNSALNIDIAMATQMTQITQEQLQGVRLTISEKEKTLYQLQDEMWIGESEDGTRVTIGVCPVCTQIIAQCVSG